MNFIVRKLRKLLKPEQTIQGRMEELKKHGMVIGEKCYIALDVEFEEAWATHVRIGNEVTIARGTRFISHDASSWRAIGITRVGKIEIGDRAFIGAHSLVMPNVKIGADVIVGSGSVVTRDVPDGTVVAGNPAREICKTAELHEKLKSKSAKGPSFGEEYRMRRGGTIEMRKAMLERMPNGEAFIVFEGAARGLKPEVEL